MKQIFLVILKLILMKEYFKINVVENPIIENIKYNRY